MHAVIRFYRSSTCWNGSSKLKRAAILFILPLLLLFLSATRLSFAQTSVPTIISHQGRLLNASSQPVTTNVSVEFKIYDALTGGTQVWTETQSITPDNLGFYDTFLGGVSALPATLPNPSYLQIIVQGETLSPRLQFGSVPFAQVAGTVPWSGLTGFPSGCPSGQFVTGVGSSLTCSTTGPASFPWFIAYSSSNFVSGASGTWNTTIYDVVTAGNSGAWYNTSNGRFTAPVKGLYWFHSQHYIYSAVSGAEYLHHTLGVNGSRNSGGGQSPSGAFTIFDLNQPAPADEDSSTDVTRLLYLNAGDYVNVNVYVAPPGGNYMSGQQSYFAGYLVQELP